MDLMRERAKMIIGLRTWRMDMEMRRKRIGGGHGAIG